MQREIVQVICDGCGKTGELVEYTLPKGWAGIAMYSKEERFEMDVCSSGCAENGAIKIIREKIYND